MSDRRGVVDRFRRSGGARRREHPVQGGAIDAEVAGDRGLGYAGADPLSRLFDLIVGELACAAPVLAGRLGDPDAFALPFADEGALELGEGAEEIEHEPADRVVGVEAVGLLLLDEVNGSALRGDLVDDVTKIAQRPRETIHRSDSDRVAVADVQDAVEQRCPICAGPARHLLLEHPIDVANRLKLTAEVLIE